MQEVKRAVVARAFAVLLSIVAPGVAHGAIQGIVKIADQSTPIPGGTGNFASFSQPQVSLGNILFHGRDVSGNGGLYWFDPASRQLSFALTGSPTFAVYGHDLSYLSRQGFNSVVYTTRGGLHVAADGFSAPSPQYGPEGPLSMDDRAIGFKWTFENGPNFVPRVGKVSADGSITSEGPTLGVDRYLIRGGRAVYSHSQRVLVLISATFIASSAGGYQFTPSYDLAGWSSFRLPGDGADTTVDPGSSSNYWSDDGTAVVFTAKSRPKTQRDQVIQRGVYTSPSLVGQLRTVANNYTLIPGRDNGATFDNFGDVTIDGGNIAFIAGSATGPLGIFAESGRVLREIISVGDTLDGKTVNSLSFSNDRPLSGYDLVFTATFSDGSTGLFLAQVPEPAGVTLVCLGAVALLGRRRIASGMH